MRLRAAWTSLGMEVLMFVSLEKTLRVCSYLACAMVLGMIAIFFATGVGQDPLQFVHPVEEYAAILLKNPAALRACVGLDNFFIVFYSTAFLLLGVLLLRRGSARALVGVALACFAALALLDMAENFHFLTMLAAAENGLPPSALEIKLQVWESLLKFHIGYLGVFLLGLALPRDKRSARVLADLSLYVQLPVGVLIYVTPHAISLPLVFVRFSFFVVGLVLVAAAFGDAKGGSGAPALSPDRTPAGAAGYAPPAPGA
jgi:hypothetical protein